MRFDASPIPSLGIISGPSFSVIIYYASFNGSSGSLGLAVDFALGFTGFDNLYIASVYSTISFFVY